MPSLTPMLGAMYIGVVLASSLYGVTSLQTYIYFARGPSDAKPVQSLVFFLWILNTLRIASVAAAGYTYMVTDFAHPAAVLQPTWTIFPAAVILVGLNNALVRGMFCFRIWRLSGKHWWIASSIALIVAVTFGITIAFSIVAHEFESWQQLDLPESSWMLSSSFATGMAGDILISTSLSVLLAMRKTGYRRSDNVVRSLIMYSVNNAVLSTTCGMLVLVTYLTAPANFAFLALYIIYPELILNALLATLNGRPALKKKMMTGGKERRATMDPIQASARLRESANHVVELCYLDSTMSEGTTLPAEGLRASDKTPYLCIRGGDVLWLGSVSLLVDLRCNLLAAMDGL
ncbi:hypothetical protein BC628DRAFT_874719 [Trametes gibbosa]|nr:hypothetical protein BC628DRAFT_874719 [Trametes gibbosa]